MATESDTTFGPDWVLLKDAVEILGTSAKTIRRRVNRGLLEGRREGDRPNGRLWILISKDVRSQPSAQAAAAQIELRDAKRDLEETKAWGAEQARLRADADQRAEAATQARKNASADAKAASQRHNSERKTLEDENAHLRQETQEWRHYSVGVEKARDDAEEERDRYLELYESAAREVKSLREAGRRHDSVVSALNDRDRKQNSEIRRLQDENTRLQAEPAELEARIKEKDKSLHKGADKLDRVREIGGRLVLLSAVAGASACVFGVALYVLVRAPAALILLAS